MPAASRHRRCSSSRRDTPAREPADGKGVRFTPSTKGAPAGQQQPPACGGARSRAGAPRPPSCPPPPPPPPRRGGRGGGGGPRSSSNRPSPGRGAARRGKQGSRRRPGAAQRAEVELRKRRATLAAFFKDGCVRVEAASAVRVRGDGNEGRLPGVTEAEADAVGAPMAGTAVAKGSADRTRSLCVRVLFVEPQRSLEPPPRKRGGSLELRIGGVSAGAKPLPLMLRAKTTLATSRSVAPALRKGEAAYELEWTFDDPPPAPKSPGGAKKPPPLRAGGGDKGSDGAFMFEVPQGGVVTRLMSGAAPSVAMPGFEEEQLGHLLFSVYEDGGSGRVPRPDRAVAQ